MMSMFVAWTMSRWADSQYLYIAYGHDLAAKHTAFIKRIIECTAYQQLFDIRLRHDSKAKDFFQTTQGGTVRAFGSSSAVTGQDAGLPGLARFSGCIICDDLIKPDDANSSTIRESVLRNYQETILQRPRGPNVPIICIAQRLHEDDICAHMLSGNDERRWKNLILKSIDEAGNALYPEVNPLEQLREKQEKSPYVFASQYQQDPIPAGGALFKREHFALVDEDPEMLCTFLTCDTAETNKSYNDASAFCFWGLYYIPQTTTFALHCIDALETRVEPKDLQATFLSFFGDCMLYKSPPQFAAIEKKSTGVTLLSVLSELRGLQLREVKRTAASGSKTTRFLEMQPIIASKLVSFTTGRFHVEPFINHMMKITANDSHRHDDLADCMYDAIKIGLIDKTLYIPDSANMSKKTILKNMQQDQQSRQRAFDAARTRR